MAKSFREAVLRDRVEWLERELKKARRLLDAYAKPTQQSLPGAPAVPGPTPRALSQQQEDLEEFEDSRRTRLEEIGVNAAELLDEKHHPVFVNVTMKKVRDACDDDDALLAAVFDRYFNEQWPARYDPPYNFRTFASEKVWPKIVEQVKTQRARNGAPA